MYVVLFRCPANSSLEIFFSLIVTGLYYHESWLGGKGSRFFLPGILLNLSCCSRSLFIFLSLSTAVQRTDYSFSLRITLMYLETDHVCAQSSFLWTKCSWSNSLSPLGLFLFSWVSPSARCLSSSVSLSARPFCGWDLVSTDLIKQELNSGAVSAHLPFVLPHLWGLHNLEFIALSLMCELRITMPLSRSAIWPFISHSLK